MSAPSTGKAGAKALAPHRTVLQMLEDSGAFVKPTGRRGRPGLNNLTLRHVSRLFSYRLAQEVFREEAALGDKRGAQATAIRNVAARHRTPVMNVKQYAKRYRCFRDVARGMYGSDESGRELERRMLGFPPDVREKLITHTYFFGLLQALRELHIDGTCPGWLIEQVRSRDFSSPK